MLYAQTISHKATPKHIKNALHYIAFQLRKSAITA